jgi:hypothetical protein
VKIRDKATYHALKDEGKCVQCGKRYAIPGETMCEWCKEHKAELNRQESARAAEKGFCGRHRTRKVVPTYKQCIVCLIADRNRKRKAGKGVARG